MESMGKLSPGDAEKPNALMGSRAVCRYCSKVGGCGRSCGRMPPQVGCEMLTYIHAPEKRGHEQAGIAVRINMTYRRASTFRHPKSAQELARVH